MAIQLYKITRQQFDQLEDDLKVKGVSSQFKDKFLVVEEEAPKKEKLIYFFGTLNQPIAKDAAETPIETKLETIYSYIKERYDKKLKRFSKKIQLKSSIIKEAIQFANDDKSFEVSFIKAAFVKDNLIVGTGPDAPEYQTLETKPSSEAAKKQQTMPKKTPSTNNISLKSDTEHSIVIEIGDIRLLTSIASVVLKDVAAKMKEYDVVLDTPINLPLQALRITQLESEVRHALSEDLVNYDDRDSVKIKFDLNYNFKGLLFVKQENNQLSNEASLLIEQSRYFSDSTTNSIIASLSAIYNRYGERIKQSGVNYYSQNSIFYSEETLRFFLDTYVYPRSSIVLSPITKDIIEKFMIGDVRLLNEEVYKKYFVDPSQVPDGVRNNLQRQISQQYEAIGDLLGDSWISGKFDTIDDVDDLYESLLNYISIEDLISISTLCLLKLIPIDELLDLICKPILKEFDKHKEAIIQGLEEMDDGIAKDLARQLKEIYFNRIIGDRGLIGDAIGAIQTGVRNIPQNLQDASTLISWQQKTYLQTYVDLTVANRDLLVDSLTDGEISLLTGTPLDGPPSSAEKTFAHTGLIQRKDRLASRRENLIKERDKVTNQLTIFNGINEPQNLVDLRNYYSAELSRIQSDILKIEAAIVNGKELFSLYETVINEVIPRLINIDPYIKPEEKTTIAKKGKPYITIEAVLPPEDSIQFLNDLRIDIVKGNEPIFSFSPGKLNRSDFDRQIEQGFRLIIDKIQQLQDPNNAQSPFNVLATFENAGVGAIEDYFFNTDTSDGKPLGLFGDPTKRRYLCLAIIAAVPAAGYLIWLFFKNLDESVEFLRNEAVAIGNAFKRKIEILAKTDYPLLDILSEFVESLKQVGLNFARDLVINGAMFVLRKIKEACNDTDVELTNAPFNPIGAIDLTSFMATSRKGPNGQETGDISNSDSFKKISAKDARLTQEQFQQVLSALSSSLTINEIASLLDDTATDGLYQKAINILKSLVPEVIKKTSSFYQYYVNEEGIREFFDLISDDIETSKIAQAKREYRLQKQTIVDICLGNDDSLLKDLLGDTEDAKQALADNYASKVNTLPALVTLADNLFGPISVPDPCDMGISTLTESQKFTARQASDSIYGTLEKQFEDSVARTKTLLLDNKGTVSKFSNLKMVDTKPKSFFDFVNSEDRKQEILDISEDNKFVSKNTLLSYKSLFDEKPTTKLEFKKSVNPNGLSLTYENKESLKGINFKFDYASNRLDFQYSNIVSEEGNNSNFNDTIVAYIQNDYFPKKSDGDTLTPGEILFNGMTNADYKGIITQPDYNVIVENALSETLLQDKDGYYLRLLNSIFKDLSLYSLRTGLYKRSNFNKFNLNKHLLDEDKEVNGQILDACFLGFANKEVLHRQTEYIADLLSCRDNSATKTPFNMAYIKILFDCFIRSVVLQEMMSSFFVMGIFPQDLILDEISPNNNSLYEQIINFNVVKSIETFSPVRNKLFTYDSFYNNVFKSFIVDITKVITGLNEITDKQAYDFIINSQIQFVKNQFAQAYTNAFGASEMLVGANEYQLLPSVNQTDPDKNISLLEITDDFTYDERLRAIQNDGLATWYELTTKEKINENNVPETNTKVFFGGQTLENLNPDGSSTILPLEFNDMMPLFLRQANGEAEYIDISDFSKKKSSAPRTLSDKNLDGLVLDKYIEMKPKHTAFNESQLNYIGIALKLLGVPVYKNDEPISTSVNVSIYRRNLRNFLYETRLFMFFPQIIDFIETLTVKKDQNPLWKEYSDKFGNFDLFYWMFRYNWDPDFFNDPEAINWHQKMLDEDIWSKLNLSLMGKVKLGDFYSLLNRFLYVYNASFGEDEGVPKVNPTNYENNTLTLEYIYSEVDAPISVFSVSQGIRFRQFFEHIDTLKSSDAFPGQLALKALGLEKEDEEIFQNQSLFSWLSTKKINDLFDFNTTIRIDMKLEDSEFSLTKAFSEKALPDGSPSVQILNQKAILEEKIGPESLGADIISSKVFSSPIFELKQKVPDELTWLNFFANVDKKSYRADDDNEDFYVVEDKKDKTVNEMLFKDDKKDIYSYFYRLKAFSTVSFSELATIDTFQYVSTYWWNIEGTAVDLKSFIRHMFGDPDEVDLNKFAGKDEWNLNNLLTERSKRSFLLDSLSDEYSDDEKKTPLVAAAEVGEGVNMSAVIDINDAAYTTFNPKRDDSSSDDGTFYLKQVETSNVEIYQNIIIKTIQECYSPKNMLGFFLSDDDKASGNIFSEKINPYIEIKINKDWLFWDLVLLTDAVQAEQATQKPIALKQFPGSVFSDRIRYDFSKNEKQPIGPPSKTDATFAIKKNRGYLSPVIGGLGSVTKEVVTKPINNNVNIYDLFSKIINTDGNEFSKETFEDLLNAFFIKEQTTIVALIHRILLEKEYPAIKEIFNSLTDLCYKNLSSAIAAANGDYQHSSPNQSVDFGPAAREIGQQLLEGFLKAIASTVDPTWKTPWFTPGPLTPFGIVAKLLDEDGEDEKEKTPDSKIPQEFICDDSLKSSVDFFKDFTKTWRDSIFIDNIVSTPSDGTDQGESE